MKNSKIKILFLLLTAYRSGAKIPLLCGTALLAFGCGGTTIVEKTETIIKYDTIKVPVPVISDSLQAVYDSVFFHGEKIVDKDTVIEVRYYPEEKYFYVKAKPDTVIVSVADTTVQIRKAEIIKEPGFLEKNFPYIITILTVVSVIIVFVIIGFNKLKNIFWFK